MALLFLAKQFVEWTVISKRMISKQVKTKEEEEEEEDEEGERTGMVWTMGKLRTKEEQWENIYKKVKKRCESLLWDKLPCTKIVVIKTREAQNISAEK